MKSSKSSRILYYLAHPGIFFYATLWLMVLLVVGTIAQKDLGLYLAQQKYFSSWVFFQGPLPFPGGRLTLSIVFVNLTVYLVSDPKARKKLGLLVTHLGTLLLLVGGLLTAYFSSEGSMTIKEGDTSAIVQDYHLRELAFIDHRSTEHDTTTAFAMKTLHPGQILSHPTLGGTITVQAVFPHCEVVERSEPSAQYKGFGRQFSLVPRQRLKENEQNMFGLDVELRGFGDQSDGRYLLIEFIRVPQQLILADGGTATLTVRKKETPLPFSIELLDFEKKLHPGTGMAKSYKSIVHLWEEGQSRRVVIQMNEPLRHKGYTFYQASFIENGPTETTVLAVVKNFGRQFPYVSSLIMCLGLLIYLIEQLPRLIKRTS
jgi:hypothetical protein